MILEHTKIIRSPTPSIHKYLTFVVFALFYFKKLKWLQDALQEDVPPEGPDDAPRAEDAPQDAVSFAEEEKQDALQFEEAKGKFGEDLG